MAKCPEKVVLDGQQVEYLSVAVHDTRLLMEHGTTNYLEVLTAQQSLLSSRLTLVSDRNSEIQSVISLYHALGGGLIIEFFSQHIHIFIFPPRS